uniref:Uncharacterized protein n=1 Tax=Monodelphis domestica TaxID=13616 RepID=A0A5F8G9X9_MONDO
MDNINIRRNRRSGEVERLRMWTDTEFENMDMYSRVKRRRKSLRRNSYGIQNHHEVSTEGEEEGWCRSGGPRGGGAAAWAGPGLFRPSEARRAPWGRRLPPETSDGAFLGAGSPGTPLAAPALAGSAPPARVGWPDPPKSARKAGG